MSETPREAIEAVLAGYTDPYLGVDLVAAGAVRDIKSGDDGVEVVIELGFPNGSYADELRQELAQRLNEVAADIRVTVETRIESHTVQRNLKPMGEIRNIIAVSCAKGGVGKSTTAVNLALALAADGARAGLLDADIYGPSQPRMLGLRGQQPVSKDGKSLEPLVAHGVECMSIGFLIDEEQPMVWRGPMVTKALQQLIGDTHWGALDYLIIDLPPGTGDIQLTLSQRVPVSGAVIVTTPQDIALLDARKGLKMFQKVDVTVLGIVENMSFYVCPECGHEETIFGSGGGERMAQDYDTRLLGRLPLDSKIREQADSGRPTVVAEPGSRNTERYRDIARSAAAQLSLSGKDYSRLFPKIVVEDT